MSGPEPSETTPEPPSPSTTSRPLPSDSSAQTTPTSPAPCSGLAAFPTSPSHLEAGLGTGPRPLALFEEELSNQQPRVPALLRPMAPYSALGEGESEGEETSGRSLGAPLGVAAPSLQAPLGLLLALRLPWVVGAGGVLLAASIGALLGACLLGASPAAPCRLC
ncbi:solute carrier family 12 member 7-like [Melanerpes formicivorus]|uniref:solute carrier family 12 member 7-like n=1 Tax=Melanerpes formicivorus TaxID=211600 RepID=UPI00358E3EEC